MDDITEARQRMLRHALDRGPSWQRTLDELAAAEAKRDQQFAQSIAAMPLGSDTPRERLQNWGAGVRDSIAWYEQLSKTLRQSKWRAKQKSQSITPKELGSQLALIECRIADYKAHAALLDLEKLEYARRKKGRLGEQEWQKTHKQLLAALQHQRATWHQKYGADLPYTISDHHLAACERLRVTQVTTLGLWDNKRGVDRNGLRNDMAAVSSTIEMLRRKPVARSGIGWGGWAAAAVIAVALMIAFNSGASNSAPTPGTTATPRQALAAPIVAPPVTLVPTPIPAPTGARAAAQALDDQGIALLKQSHCDQAIELFGQAAVADPTWHQPLSDMAFCMYERGEAYAAIASWQDALALNRSSPDANAGLGMALYAAGTRDQGIMYYQRALQADPHYGDEDWMRRERQWSDKAIADSRPLREQLLP